LAAQDSQAIPLDTLTEEDRSVAKRKQQEPIDFQLGDRVQIRYYPDWKGRIVELRGALGPGGVDIYRVRIGRTARPILIEVRGDQLIRLPARKKRSRNATPGEAEAAQE
jgi:hypothetical protein